MDNNYDDDDDDENDDDDDGDDDNDDDWVRTRIFTINQPNKQTMKWNNKYFNYLNSWWGRA